MLRLVLQVKKNESFFFAKKNVFFYSLAFCYTRMFNRYILIKCYVILLSWGRWGYFEHGASSDQPLSVLFLQHHVTYSIAVTAIFFFNRHIGLVAKSSSVLLNFIFMIFDKKVRTDETKS